MQSLYRFIEIKKSASGIRTSLENFGQIGLATICPLYAIGQYATRSRTLQITMMLARRREKTYQRIPRANWYQRVNSFPIFLALTGFYTLFAFFRGSASAGLS